MPLLILVFHILRDVVNFVRTILLNVLNMLVISRCGLWIKVLYDLRLIILNKITAFFSINININIYALVCVCVCI